MYGTFILGNVYMYTHYAQHKHSVLMLQESVRKKVVKVAKSVAWCKISVVHFLHS